MIFSFSFFLKLLIYFVCVEVRGEVEVGCLPSASWMLENKFKAASAFTWWAILPIYSSVFYITFYEIDEGLHLQLHKLSSLSYVFTNWSYWPFLYVTLWMSLRPCAWQANIVTPPIVNYEFYYDWLWYIPVIVESFHL